MKRLTFQLLPFLCAFILSVHTMAQSGDNCANAIPFPVNINECNYTLVSHEGLSNSGQVPIGTGCTGFNSPDLWLSFEMPPSGEVYARGALNLDHISFFVDVTMAVYSGECGNLTQIDCDDDGANSVNFPAMTITGEAGETYFIQLSAHNPAFLVPYNFCINGTPTCTSPEATFTERCLGNNQYDVAVDITNMGDASELTITDGTTTWVSGITSIGVYAAGPFNLGEDQNLTVAHAEDASCNITEYVSDVGLACENILSCGTPLNQTYCYGNNDNTGFAYTSPGGAPITLTFLSGSIVQGADVIHFWSNIDGTGPAEETFNSSDDLTGFSFQSLTGNIYMEVDSDPFVSCQVGGGNIGLDTGWNWTVSCDVSVCDDAVNIESETTFAESLLNADLVGQSYSGLAQCAGPGGNADQFYTFTAIGSVQYIRIEVTGDFDPIVEVFDACDGNSIACINEAGAGQRELFWLTDLTIGNQYVFRVYNNGASIPSNSEYTAAVAHIPVVQLRTQDCGSTDLTTNDIIRSTQPDPIFLLEGFIWEFTDVDTDEVFVIDSPNGSNPQFRMFWFEDLQYEHTYDVRIKTRMYQGPNEGEYGPSCQITMGQAPVTAMQSQYTFEEFGIHEYCDVVKAETVQGASSYSWIFDDGNGTELEYNHPNPGSKVCRLKNVDGLLMGETYSVQVFVTSQGVTSTTSEPRTIVMNDQVSDTELNSEILACGSSVALTGSSEAINICGADQYTFRFTNLTAPEEPVIEKVRNNRVIPFSQVPGLIAGHTYSVTVRARQGGIYGDYGNACEVSFLLPPSANEFASVSEESASIMETEVPAELSIHPNPVTDDNDQVMITISDMTSAQHEVIIRMYDMSGRLMTSEVYGNNGATFKSILTLDEEYATGIYLVTSTVDGQVVESKKLIVE